MQSASVLAILIHLPAHSLRFLCCRFDTVEELILVSTSRPPLEAKSILNLEITGFLNQTLLLDQLFHFKGHRLALLASDRSDEAASTIFRQFLMV
jgi:hypothetical protein